MPLSLSKKESFLLLFGDLVSFVLALCLALTARYFELPSEYVFYLHLYSFVPIFILSATVFFIAGLYGKHTLLFKRRLPSLLFYTQLWNSVIAISFFYFVPYLTVVTPKTVLFLYLFISSGLVLFWRTKIVASLGFRRKQNALLVGGGKEARELFEEVNGNSRYAFSFVSLVDLSRSENVSFEGDILAAIAREKVTMIVLDMDNKKIEPLLPHFYELMFEDVRFIEMSKIYEDIFDRVPLSFLNYAWFLEHLSVSSHPVYDAVKRFVDILAAILLGIPSLIAYPFAYMAVKLDDGGPLFITQERMGANGRRIKIHKMRTMSGSDKGKWLSKDDERVTRAGKFLRKTRIDELPQLWNIILGDISLIGPRPDVVTLGEQLHAEIPYYNIRYLIKPGLSGWAQIKQDLPPQSVEETRTRLAYDLYYIKNRSLMLDIVIMLKTVKTLLSRQGL
jgi:exopolysaccharide biosynthesis polyprenyl glycosylphosphotransferase